MKTKLDNKTKIIILKRVIDRLDIDYIYRGICFHIDGIMYSDYPKFHIEMKKWFANQKPRPRKHYEFTKDKSFYGGSMWWWNCNKNGLEERKRFLRYLIKTLT